MVLDTGTTTQRNCETPLTMDFISHSLLPISSWRGGWGMWLDFLCFCIFPSFIIHFMLFVERVPWETNTPWWEKDLEPFRCPLVDVLWCQVQYRAVHEAIFSVNKNSRDYRAIENLSISVSRCPYLHCWKRQFCSHCEENVFLFFLLCSTFE